MRITKKRLRQIIREELILEGGYIQLPAHPAVMLYDQYAPAQLKTLVRKHTPALKSVAAKIEKSPTGKSLMRRFGITPGGLWAATKAGARVAWPVYLMMHASGEAGFDIGTVLNDVYGPTASGETIQIDIDKIDLADFKEKIGSYSLEIAQSGLDWLTHTPGKILQTGGEAIQKATTPTASGKTIQPDPTDIDWGYALDQWSDLVTFH